MFDFLKSPGKMEVVFEKMNFNPGEKIKGKVILEMNKSKDAKGLWIRFWGERQVKKPFVRRDPKTGQTIQTTTLTTENIYECKKDLDGMHMYSGNVEYEFEFDAPTSNASFSGEAGSIASAAINLAKTMGADIPAPPKWYVEADLDIPKGKDVYKKVQINIPGLMI